MESPMKGKFVLGSNESPIEGNVYANKSSLILSWLLQKGIEKDIFSLREVAEKVGVSIGLVQRVFSILVLKGFLQTEGIRTSKKFFFTKSKHLLKDWLEHYNIIKKCKVRTYYSAFSGKPELLKALKQSGFNQKVVLALHSAAEAHGYKNTNLNTLELYILDPSIRIKLEKALQLEPRERGYEVLLIEPYYKVLLNQNRGRGKKIGISPILLTFLDLYHFPLRGLEQAEFIAEKVPGIKRIFGKG